ncbi:glycosyl hydrolase family 18 protein [Priestia endophytica]|uniref:GH18 domain-containing protein n=1 Tax=Priestia endophytica TaxID=135735 RepID=A0AAX1QDW7_9BACI|nr:glycosyl hydrolase family 18 protein [Priestia endophytica]RAS82171.1 hypothetical protein A3864_01290 [Priestia endophytica]RAS84465.1 hypothetical protein A3863_25030 [Priestia endophytica]
MKKVCVVLFCASLLSSGLSPYMLKAFAQDLTSIPVGNEGEDSFRIMGYYSANDNVDLEKAIQWESVTHVIYGSLYMEKDGKVSSPQDTEKLKELVLKAHEHGVKVLIDLKEADTSAYAALPAEEIIQKTFSEQVKNLIQTYGVDGINVDWAPQDEKEKQLFYIELIHELDQISNESQTLLTLSVRHSTGETKASELSEEVKSILAAVDWVNIMPTNDTETMSYEESKQTIAYWTEQVGDGNKITLSIPVSENLEPVETKSLAQEQSKPKDVEEMPKTEIKEETKESMETQETKEPRETQETVQEKTNLALNKTGGVIVLENEENAQQNETTLKQIHSTVTETEELEETQTANKVKNDMPKSIKWQPTKTYEQGEIVKHNGVLYIAQWPVKEFEPEKSNTAYSPWVVVGTNMGSVYALLHLQKECSNFYCFK